MFSPMAARLVNARNLSMSAVCRDLSMRSGCFSSSFYTSAQPSLLWKVCLFSFSCHTSQVCTCGLSHTVLSVGYHTPPGFDRTKKIQPCTLTNNNMHFYYSDSKGLCFNTFNKRQKPYLWKEFMVIKKDLLRNLGLGREVNKVWLLLGVSTDTGCSVSSAYL